MKRATRRSMALLGGTAFLLAAAGLLAALISYRSSDPSLNTSAGGPVLNWLGTFGAYLADTVLTLFGPPVAMILPLLLVFGLRLARGSALGPWVRALSLSATGIILVGAGAGLLAGEAINGLPAGWGGAFGLSLARLFNLGLVRIGDPAIVAPFRVAAVCLLAFAGLFVWYLGLGLRPEERGWIASRRTMPTPAPRPAPTFEEDEEEDEPVTSRAARTPTIRTPEPSRPVIADRA
jgi:S-DNA-T family DNA segregation ATPase FtsK/SpoIIIE